MRRFDPYALTPESSLNRVYIEDVDGVRADLVGQRVHPLLSAESLSGVNVREAAARLTALVATLLSPATAERQGETPLRRAALAHWLTVETIWIGGGVAARFGRALVEAVEARRARLHMAEAPETLALTGLAREAQDGDLVFDFGHTAAKRGVVHDARVHVLPSITAPPGLNQENAPGYVREALLATKREYPAARSIHVSLATYLDRGRRPVANFSVYTGLGENPTSELETLVDVPVRLVHDGTAAALAFSGESHTAVIMMGTALGSGFAPPRR